VDTKKQHLSVKSVSEPSKAIFFSFNYKPFSQAEGLPLFIRFHLGIRLGKIQEKAGPAISEVFYLYRRPSAKNVPSS
jgi:hypothetical protein